NRSELQYPPFSAMIKIDFTGTIKEQVKKSAMEFINYINQSGLIEMYHLESQLNIDHLIITKDREKEKASFAIKINIQKQNISPLKDILFKYILKFKSNEVKLLVDVDPTKMW
ncbi:MAG: hypothetical protein JXC36_04385, partial [Candidatus Atribacteria bacterium]|nr:hypothetical protein [Candidatus Atribacteria bacterium]